MVLFLVLNTCVFAVWHVIKRWIAGEYDSWSQIAEDFGKYVNKKNVGTVIHLQQGQ